MKRHLFGTDGIRGEANVEPMTVETAVRLGAAIAHRFRRDGGRGRILIGKDTRLSGYLFETALTAGGRLQRDGETSERRVRPRRLPGLGANPEAQASWRS